MNIEFKTILRDVKNLIDFAVANGGLHSARKAVALDAAIDAFMMSEKLLAIGQNIDHAGKIERAQKFLHLSHDIAQRLMDQGIRSNRSAHLPAHWDLY